jgi:hypothetical protein
LRLHSISFGKCREHGLFENKNKTAIHGFSANLDFLARVGYWFQLAVCFGRLLVGIALSIARPLVTLLVNEYGEEDDAAQTHPNPANVVGIGIVAGAVDNHAFQRTANN